LLSFWRGGGGKNGNHGMVPPFRPLETSSASRTLRPDRFQNLVCGTALLKPVVGSSGNLTTVYKGELKKKALLKHVRTHQELRAREYKAAYWFYGDKAGGESGG